MMGNKKVGLISFSFSSYSCKTNTTAWFIMSVISEEEITSAEWWLILY